MSLLHRILRLCPYLFFAVLILELFGRVLFPYDMYFASESPILTHIWKMDQGIEIYTQPAEVNSHTYTPGLELLGYWLLRPFQLGTDIRFHRLLTILLGFLSAGIGARIIKNQTPTKKSDSQIFFFCIISLLIFRSLSADVLHPDNLHIFTTVATFAFTIRAIQTNQYRWAIGAIVISSLAVLGKQTGAFTYFATILLLVWMGNWSFSKKLYLFIGGTVLCCLSIYGLYTLPYASYYTFDVLQQHQIDWAKLLLIPRTFIKIPNLGVIALTAPYAIWYLWKNRMPHQTCLFQIWGVIGFFGVAPALLAYLKDFGTWNNFTLIAVWLFFPIALWLQQAPHKKWILYLFVVTLVPVKMIPTPAMYSYFETVETRISADIRTNKTIWYPHGASILIRADAPMALDRANTYLDMWAGGEKEKTGTIQRIEEQYYDRIYMNTFWYSAEVKDALLQYYTPVDTIIYDGWKPRFINGFQASLLEDTTIYEPKE